MEGTLLTPTTPTSKATIRTRSQSDINGLRAQVQRDRAVAMALENEPHALERSAGSHRTYKQSRTSTASSSSSQSEPTSPNAEYSADDHDSSSRESSQRFNKHKRGGSSLIHDSPNTSGEPLRGRTKTTIAPKHCKRKLGYNRIARNQ